MRLASLVVLILVAFSVPAGAQTETVVYSFGSAPIDGYQPAAPLLMDGAGNLFGTTVLGSDTLCDLGEVFGCGTVYELVKSSNGYTEKLLYSFGSSSPTSDGASPQAGLIMDAAGNLYGTTTYGGSSNCLLDIGSDGCGTVFELVKSSTGYTEEVLYTFTGFDGAYPLAGLTIDSAGNLYGTTSNGGANDGYGVVFELVNSAGTYTYEVLYNFGATATDGRNPLGGLVMDSAGNLYGTTSLDTGSYSCGLSACGTVFELVNSADGYSEKILYTFSESGGANPEAGLIMDSSGNLYGTASNGGAYGSGTVFELVNSSGNYTEKVLHSFGGTPTDGVLPIASLVMDDSGNLFGTTNMGGSATLCGGYGCGTAFELLNSSGTYTERVLHGFGGVSDGESPDAALVMDSAGNLYGTTPTGGLPYEVGTAFEISPTAAAPTVALSASGLTFDQLVDTTSPAQGVTVMNSGPGNLIFGSSGVTLSGVNAAEFAISADSCSNSTVAPNGSCSASVTFSPTVPATETATLTFSDNAVVSAQAVTLTGMGLTQNASVTLSPQELNFSSQMVSTTSAAQPVTLMNSGVSPLSITSISASVGFEQTNNCGSSLGGAASCTIQVSFAPTMAYPQSGALSITDNAGGSPQTVALTGTGADFTIAVASGSPQSLSVSPGESANYSLTVTPEGGFNQTVSVGCSGAPALATCSVSPSMPAINGSAAIPLTVYVTTTAPAFVVPQDANFRTGLPGTLVVTLLGVIGLLILRFGVRRSVAGTGRCGLLAILLLTAAFWSCSCGGGGGGAGSPGTPAGSYTLTITATVGTLTNSTTLTLGVN